MTTKEIVDSIMSRQDAMSPSEVYRLLGINSNAFANQMKRGIKTVKLFARVLRVLGYRIVVVPEKTEMSDEWFEVE